MLCLLTLFAVIPFSVPTYAQTAPFFKMTMMIPNNDQTRMIWSTQVALTWQKLGIDIEYVYVPWSIIDPRRIGTPLGRTYADGGYDAHTERYYYDTLTPDPFSLFHSSQFPPTGVNYGLVNSKELDKIILNYDQATSVQDHMYWMNEFEKWYMQNMPMPVVYYPTDLIAINPKLQGFETRDGSTWNFLFYPHPEEWTNPGKTTAAFAVCCPTPPLLPQYSIGYDQSDVFGPVHNRLFEYQGWFNKTLRPALATDVNISPDGLTWVINLRQGVKWHDDWPFNATDVKYTFDLIMNADYASLWQSRVGELLGGPNGVAITGPYQVTLHLTKYGPLQREFLLSTIAILPWHAYKDLGPADIGRGGLNPANTWQGTYTVKKLDGSNYVAHGPIGTGPWISMGYDPVKKAFHYVRNHNYWMQTPGNIEEFYIVEINGADAAIAALKAGEIDAMDTMYSIQTLLPTIDPAWGKVIQSDSYKWQHVILNMQNPIFGTGADTPLGRKDPSRAAEAATYVRQALNLAVPREQIINHTLRGFGVPGTVPIAYSAAEYNHTLLQPKPFDLAQAKSYMEKAGFSYQPAAPPNFMELYGTSLIAAIAVVVIIVAAVAYLAGKSRSKKS